MLPKTSTAVCTGGTDRGTRDDDSVGRIESVLCETTLQEERCGGNEEHDEEEDDEEEGDDRAVGTAEGAVEGMDAGPYASTNLRTCAATDMASRSLSMEQGPVL